MGSTWRRTPGHPPSPPPSRPQPHPPLEGGCRRLSRSRELRAASIVLEPARPAEVSSLLPRPRPRHWLRPRRTLVPPRPNAGPAPIPRTGARTPTPTPTQSDLTPLRAGSRPRGPQGRSSGLEEASDRCDAIRAEGVLTPTSGETEANIPSSTTEEPFSSGEGGGPRAPRSPQARGLQRPRRKVSHPVTPVRAHRRRPRHPQPSGWYNSSLDPTRQTPTVFPRTVTVSLQQDGTWVP